MLHDSKIPQTCINLGIIYVSACNTVRLARDAIPPKKLATQTFRLPTNKNRECSRHRGKYACLLDSTHLAGRVVTRCPYLGFPTKHPLYTHVRIEVNLIKMVFHLLAPRPQISPPPPFRPRSVSARILRRTCDAIDCHSASAVHFIAVRFN